MELALRAGFQRAGIVDPDLLRSWTPRLPPSPAAEWDWIRDAAEWSRSSTILVCCLSCRRIEPDDNSSPGDPHGLVAPFARAHYYREAVRMLRGVVQALAERTGMPRAGVRLFSNSRLPEKPLLVATGLGVYGRNGCAIVPGLGSLFVIAGAVLPLPTEGVGGVRALGDLCGACRRCAAACPVSAIDEPYVLRTDLCLQAKAASPEKLTEDQMRVWGTRLYGCQDCQAACPHNAGLSVQAGPATGEIGPSLPLRPILLSDAEGRREMFRGTALGMSWVSTEALLRNALVAAGSRGDTSVRDAAGAHIGHPAAAVDAAARWARARL